MKNTFILFSILIFAFTNSDAQKGWQLIDPYPTSATLYTSSFIGADTGWIAGTGGTVLKTTNGGATWANQNAIGNTSIYKIQFLSATQGWALSSNMIVAATKDGGTTWVPQTAASSLNYASTMQFVDANHGFVLPTYDSLLYTTNGGATWNHIKIDTVEEHYDMHFVSATEGWICGFDAQILHTTDGGLTWKVQPDSITTSLQLNTIYFTDNMHGWAAGSGSIDKGVLLRTTNGGATWNTIIIGGSDAFVKIFFKDNMNGRALGSSGAIYTTANGGDTWTAVYTSGGEGFYDISIAGPNEYAVGSTGAIVKSTNSGMSYSAIYRTATHGDQIGTIDFPDVAHGWIFDGYQSALMHTSDSGTTWTDQTPFKSNFTMAGMHFVDSARGWIIGKYLSYGQILRTTDGGSTFTFQLNTGVAPIISLHFSDSLHGLAGTNTKVVYRTANGGATWDTASIPATGAYMQTREVQRVDNNNGYAVASYVYNTVLAKTTDGGATWAVIKKDTIQFTSAYTALYFIDRQHGYVATYKSGSPTGVSALLYTADGGSTWSDITIPASVSSNTINKVYFTDNMHGWVAGGGFGSFIIYTADGGATWSVQENATTVAWYGMSFPNAQTGYAAGWLGDIVRTSNGGMPTAVPVVNNLQNNTAALAVYPNPAQQNCTVQFSSDKQGTAQLSVVNITGQRVLIPAIINYQPGINSSVINISGLSNGIYFIILQTENTKQYSKIIVHR